MGAGGSKPTGYPIGADFVKTVFFLVNHVYYNHERYTTGETMRTNIIINDELINEALKLTDLKTKKAVVEEGLKLLVKIKKQEKIKSLRGKLHWTGNLEDMRLDK